MTRGILTGGLVALLAWAPLAQAGERGAFDEVVGHYEAIRRELVEDTTDGVAEHAAAIAARARELADDFSAAAAGVPEAAADECRELLPELVAAAGRLAAATGLEPMRAALFELSKPLGRYRKLAGIEDTMVVYCPMAKKAWIQPHGEIGNPYLGGSMPGCGNVIAD